jgi:cell wall-associated NlpC family hydrolase
MLDRRVNAYRDDIAAIGLRGQIPDRRFVAGVRGQVKSPSVGIFRHPRREAMRETEAIIGETLTVFERANGWAWVQLDRDGYVGYMADAAIGPVMREPTHRIWAVATFVYAAPDIKSEVLGSLTMNSLVTVKEEGVGAFLPLEGGGYVVRRHTAPATAFHADFVAVAERFVGTPYLWGGKTRLGLDCSGLVQTAMHAAGLDCPRDSDMQLQSIGRLVKDPDDKRRGDLLFWQGHVGAMIDGERLIHATAHHMEVAIEPVEAVLERNLTAGLPLLAVKRPERLGREEATRLNVLFVGTGNSGRSAMAEALLRQLGASQFVAHSAGTAPSRSVPSEVRALLALRGLELPADSPRGIEAFCGPTASPLDIVIGLDESFARGETIDWPGKPIVVAWPMPDPLIGVREGGKRAWKIEDAYRQLENWIAALSVLPMHLLDRRAREEMLDRIRIARQA